MSLFKGILKIIKKPIAFVAKTAGTLVGLPALGAGVSNLINKIGEPKVKAIAAKVAESGTIEVPKVVANLEAAGVAPTPSAVASAVAAVKEVVKADPTNPLNSNASIAVNDSNKQLPVTFKLWDYVKSYWYLALPSGLLVVYLVYKSFKK